MSCPHAQPKPGLEPAVVHPIAALAVPAPGAVVSRTLVDRPTGTVTAFAFAAGQGLSEHSAPFDALVQVTSGSITITIGGTPHEVPAGAMILMPADIPHSLRCANDATMLLTMIRGSAA